MRQSEQEPLFNSLLEQYHYLRYQHPVGEGLKYLVKTRGQVIACLAWSSAPRHLGSRDRFLGWDPRARRCKGRTRTSLRDRLGRSLVESLPRPVVFPTTIQFAAR